MVNLIDIIGKNFSLKNIKKKINGCVVEIKTYIDIEEYAQAVREMAELCFDEAGVYHPEYREFSRRYAIVKYFTNIDIENITAQELFKTSQGNDWYYQIEKEISTNPIWIELDTAVDRQIEYAISTKEDAFGRMCDKITALIESIPVDQSQSVADIKEVLTGLKEVDKDAFVNATINRHK